MEKYMNISTIGISGSGKTMFISGFNQSLIEGCQSGNNGSVISATGSLDDATFRGADQDGMLNGLTVAQIMEKYRQKRLMSVQDKNGKVSTAAAGTVEMQSFFFDLDVSTPKGIELSQTVKLTDYRGGLLSLGKNVSEVDIAECKALMDNLYASEVILILIDGQKLAQYRYNASMRKEKTGADRINVLMNALMKRPRKGVTVTVLVTKVDSDQITSDLKADRYKKLCDLAWGTIDCVQVKSKNMTRNFDWNFAVVPVTAIGENNSVTKYVPEVDEYFCAIKNGADICQKNIDTAIIYSVRNALLYSCKELLSEIEDYEAKIHKELSQMGLFNQRQRKAYIEEYKTQKDARNRKRNKHLMMINAINEGFSDRFVDVYRFGDN